jgi:16S rRNA (cytidine1402-2'-O)-methyltransferase
MASAFGDRQVTLLRETTKLHEEVRRTTLAALAADFSTAAPRGEITLVVQGSTAAPDAAPVDPADLRRRYARLIDSGADPRSALARLMKETGLRRRDLYAIVRARS